MWRVETIVPKGPRLPRGYVLQHSKGARLPIGWSAENAQKLCAELNAAAVEPEHLPLLQRA